MGFLLVGSLICLLASPVKINTESRSNVLKQYPGRMIGSNHSSLTYYCEHSGMAVQLKNMFQSIIHSLLLGRTTVTILQYEGC